MSGPAPKDPAVRRRRNAPARGDWTPTPGVGWQYGPIPAAPDGLMPSSAAAWQTWFGSWFAANWIEADLPILRQLVCLFDLVERGQAKAADRSELRQMLDSFGLTHKGRQDRRWAAPVKPEVEDAHAPKAGSSRYGHLRPVVSSERAS